MDRQLNNDDCGQVQKWRQILAAFCATLGAFGTGMALAWTSPALPHIDSTACNATCDIPNITESDASWIGAMLALGAIASGPITGFLLASIGRKWTMIGYSFVFCLGYLLFVVAYYVEDEASVWIGRVVTGFAGGSFCLTSPLYIVEIAEPSMRGALASMMQLMITLGVAFTDGLNIQDAVHWHIISMVCSAIPIITAVAMFFMPESPFYLVQKQRDDQAKSALQWLRGPWYNITKEYEELKEAHRQEQETGSIKWTEILTQAKYLKPLLIVLGLMFFQQFSGINVVIFYTQDIFNDAGSNLDPGLSAFIVAMAQVVGTVVAVLIVDLYGRKILLFLSDLFMSVSILALGVFFYLKENSPAGCEDLLDCDPKFSDDLISSLGWLPLLSLILFVISFSIGFGPLPWTVNAEIFTAEAKALASSIAFCFNWLCAFIVTKFIPDLEREIGTSSAYFLFAIICAIGTFFVFFLVPETKGKTPEELRHLFDKGSVDSQGQVQGQGSYRQLDNPHQGYDTVDG